jgi:hypothetical protein
MGAMARTTAAERKASAAEVRAHADAVRQLAADVGVTDLRLRSNGSVVVHSDEPGYRQVTELSQRVGVVVGCYVHVITDDVPGAADAQPL